MPSRLLLFVVAAFCVASIAPAQTLIGTEFFIVPDYTTVTSGAFEWDNVVLDDLSGGANAQHTITFDNQTSMGSGTYGQQYAEGAYILQALWLLDNGGTGYTSGHMHFQSTGGNPGAFERSHYNGSPDQLQGIHVSRVDGMPFQLTSVDYRNNTPQMYVGDNYASGYGSICSWNLYGATEGIVANSTTWQTFFLFPNNGGPPPPGPGQPIQPGLAVMDINSSTNANGNGTDGGCMDFNGPFFCDATPGQPLEFTFEGNANQAIILMFGALNPGAGNFPPSGQIDIGVPGPGLPGGITLAADGNAPGFLNSLFNTGPNGTAILSFTTPQYPLGILTTFQAGIYHPTGLAVTNAVQVTII